MCVCMNVLQLSFAVAVDKPINDKRLECAIMTAALTGS